ncbi:MAG: type II toxin-antitoxin system CcdA family antitoxin [Candidatus Jordarchaeales archaeon]
MVVLATSVVSVRVKRELKEEAEKLGIDLRSVVEKAIESEVRRVKKEKLKRLLEEALRNIDFTAEDWARAVRESRDKR